MMAGTYDTLTLGNASGTQTASGDSTVNEAPLMKRHDDVTEGNCIDFAVQRAPK
jgi:hypothetical protein